MWGGRALVKNTFSGGGFKNTMPRTDDFPKTKLRVQLARTKRNTGDRRPKLKKSLACENLKAKKKRGGGQQGGHKWVSTILVHRGVKKKKRRGSEWSVYVVWLNDGGGGFRKMIHPGGG